MPYTNFYGYPAGPSHIRLISRYRIIFLKKIFIFGFLGAHFCYNNIKKVRIKGMLIRICFLFFWSNTGYPEDRISGTTLNKINLLIISLAVLSWFVVARPELDLNDGLQLLQPVECGSKSGRYGSGSRPRKITGSGSKASKGHDSSDITSYVMSDF